MIIEKVLVNSVDITHVQPLSKICMLQHCTRMSQICSVFMQF